MPFTTDGIAAAVIMGFMLAMYLITTSKNSKTEVTVSGFEKILSWIRFVIIVVACVLPGLLLSREWETDFLGNLANQFGITFVVFVTWVCVTYLGTISKVQEMVIEELGKDNNKYKNSKIISSLVLVFIIAFVLLNLILFGATGFGSSLFGVFIGMVTNRLLITEKAKQDLMDSLDTLFDDKQSKPAGDVIEGSLAD